MPDYYNKEFPFFFFIDHALHNIFFSSAETALNRNKCEHRIHHWLRGKGC